MTEKTEKKVPDARQSFIYPAKGVSHKSGFEESLVSAEAAVPEVEGGRKPLSERFAREEKQ
jgi:hypothetical protein